MKVIGAGFGRTGTASLKAALEELGFGPCYHMTEVFANPEHVDFWLAAWRGESVHWEGVLGSYEASVDWPACTFYAELMQRHPDAKVLLSDAPLDLLVVPVEDFYGVVFVLEFSVEGTLPDDLLGHRPLAGLEGAEYE